MFLSKIWFILVAIVGAVALTVALTAPRPMAQKLQELEGQRLDRSQYAAEQVLKVDAHRWIDAAAQLGHDAVIAEALDSATRGSGEPSLQHKTVDGRIRALFRDLAGKNIAVLAAVDGNGRVIARVGEGEKEYGDNIGGAEVIADALRGYLSDDVWGHGGRLVRVAAAPVLSKGHERIVGALYVGAETGAQFVERMKHNLNVDAALLLRGKVIASTLEPGILATLGESVEKNRADIQAHGRTHAIPIEAGQDTYLAVAAPLSGQASQQDAYYVVIGKKPARADLPALLAATSSRDLRWGEFPWIPLMLALLGAVAVGLLLHQLEVERPIKRLRAELRGLAAGNAAKLHDHDYGGQFGGIARDVNAAIEHHTMAPSPQGPMAGKDLGAILGGDVPPPESAFARPSFPSLAAAAPVPPPGPASLPMPPPPSAAAAPALLPSAPAPGGLAPPPPPSFAPPPAAPGIVPPTPPVPRSASSLPAPAVGGFSPTSTMIGVGLGPAGLTNGDREREREREEDEAHVREVYEQFLATKQQCGEPTAGLTIDKFRLRLQENKNVLIAKHACRTVRFSVYVKDGKASLRATPVK